MKKFLKRFTKIAAVAAAFLLPTAPALPDAADQSTVTVSGLTNALVANATQTANMGDAVSIANWRSVGLQLEFVGTATNIGNVVLTFARSGDGTSFETTPRFSWTVANNGTTNVVAVTNLPNDSISSIRALRLISAQNTASTGTVITNPVLRVIRKR